MFHHGMTTVRIDQGSGGQPATTTPHRDERGQPIRYSITVQRQSESIKGRAKTCNHNHVTMLDPLAIPSRYDDSQNRSKVGEQPPTTTPHRDERGQFIRYSITVQRQSESIKGRGTTCNHNHVTMVDLLDIPSRYNDSQNPLRVAGQPAATTI